LGFTRWFDRTVNQEYSRTGREGKRAGSIRTGAVGPLWQSLLRGRPGEVAIRIRAVAGPARNRQPEQRRLVALLFAFRDDRPLAVVLQYDHERIGQRPESRPSDRRANLVRADAELAKPVLEQIAAATPSLRLTSFVTATVATTEPSVTVKTTSKPDIFANACCPTTRSIATTTRNTDAETSDTRPMSAHE
jgi:hypothetical protein